MYKTQIGGLLLGTVCLIVAGCQEKPPVKEAKVQKSYFSEKVRCSEVADKWARGMGSSDKDTKFVFDLVDYSPKQQSCIVYYNYENSSVASYYVQDVLTNTLYFNDYCNHTVKKCGEIITKSRAVFDDLVKIPE
jgi:hypothetical protein